MTQKEARIKFLTAFKSSKSKSAILAEYKLSAHWKIIRALKLEMEPACELCGRTDYTQVYHHNFRYLYDCSPFDLETLCGRCRAFKVRSGLIAKF